MTTDPSISDTLASNEALGATLASETSSSRVRTSFPNGDPTRRSNLFPTLVRDPSGDIRLEPNQGERYHRHESIGLGGMGEVLRATDNDLGRSVAIKHLHETSLSRPTDIARFIEEARTVGRLEHPNIVPIHDVGVDDQGRFFFVMRLVKGKTLEDIINELRGDNATANELFPFESRVEVFIGLLRALQFAHAHGVLHRDIKPANIMVGPFGEVFLMDWGIAKTLQSPHDDARKSTAPDTVPTPARVFETHVGAILGTPAFMSPEQARGEIDKLDVRSDLFSAGLVFYELLTLSSYFGDKPSVSATLAAVGLHKALPMLLPVSPNQPRVPAEYKHFLRQALQGDPSQRFQSATEMIHELHRIMEGRARVLCSVTFTKRMVRETGRMIDRNPRPMIAGILVITAIVVFLLVCTVLFFLR